MTVSIAKIDHNHHYPLVMFEKLLKKCQLIPKSDDLKEIIDFHISKARSVIIKKSDVSEFIASKERSMRQR